MKFCQGFKPAKIFLRKIYAGKPISISLSPNTEKDDVRLAFKLLFQPWLWKNSIFQTAVRNALYQLEEEFRNYFNVKYVFSFNSGRSAFLAILNALQEGHSSSEATPSGAKGDSAFANATADKEVLLQAFTCNAVPNPIIWSGLKPVYVDCDEGDFNIDIEDLKKKIGPRSKAVVVQHTFGCPADIDKIQEICRQNGSTSSPQGNLILIEDCAHSLGAEYGSTSSPQARRKVGTFGKVAFFSFSRDKVISSVYGGMAITNDPSLAEKLQQAQGKLSYPSHYWIFQQLLHPILINWLILPIYNFLDLGKIFLVLSQWFHILSKAVHWKEKRGKIPAYFPRRMPNALAILALNQFKKLEKFNNHRKEIADFYYRELTNTSFQLPAKFPERKNIFLRFTVKHSRAHEIIFDAWQKRNILIGDWYTTPIAPFDTQLDKIKYIQGSCPKAEKLAKTTLNLPTHINISQKDAQRIIKFLKSQS